MSSGGPAIRWGVHERLHAYTVGFAGGLLEAIPPASLDGRFGVFPLAGEPDGSGMVRARGELCFVGHNGDMVIAIGEPWVEHRAAGAVLSVVDPARVPDRSARADLASLERGEDADGSAVYVATLLPDGVRLLGGVYSAGLRLDDVRIGLQSES